MFGINPTDEMIRFCSNESLLPLIQTNLKLGIYHFIDEF